MNRRSLFSDRVTYVIVDKSFSLKSDRSQLPKALLLLRVSEQTHRQKTDSRIFPSNRLFIFEKPVENRLFLSLLARFYVGKANVLVGSMEQTECWFLVGTTVGGFVRVVFDV